MDQQWPGAGSGDLNTIILGAIGHAGTSPFERGHNYSYHSLASGKQCIPQGNTAPSISRKNCIKDLLSMAPPIRASPSHQEATTSLLFLFNRGQARTRGQVSNIHWIIKQQESSKKNINFSFTDYAKSFDCMDHSKLWKIL